MPRRQEFQFILTLSLITAPQGKHCYYTHFTDEEMGDTERSKQVTPGHTAKKEWSQYQKPGNWTAAFVRSGATLPLCRPLAHASMPSSKKKKQLTLFSNTGFMNFKILTCFLASYISPSSLLAEPK